MQSVNEKLRVVIDTNVFVSGLTFPGTPNRVLLRFLREEMDVFVSQFILDELMRILSSKFQWGSRQIGAITNLVVARAILVEPTVHVSAITRKDDDNRILECAVAARAQYIISGDQRDLLALGEFEGIGLVSPAAFLAVLDRRLGEGGP
ncbi:MAG: putative toxin-antitoxin system toxin component, PIN family [Dehalococcoidia bacterium]|nr:putative toxin-antitoxin system toxin component, PIN family [Dehalococcoidia bacterium]